jgi:Zn-dependent M16 (insulinase) family peptidase
MLTYLVGSEAEHRDAFLALYTESLEKMVKEGLDHDLVLSELNKYEFGFREEASKAQRGLDLIGKAMVGIKYETDPFDYLSSEEMIASIRHKALNEGYFEELIKKYLLDNPATVTVTLSPDPEKQQRSQQKERQRLDEYAASCSAAEHQRRIERTRELMEQQLIPNSPETLALLPQLSLADLSPEIDFHRVTPTEMFGTEVLVSELDTNHISYLDVGFDISCLTPEQLVMVDLFGTIVTEIGTKRLNYQQFAKEVATCTGSFSHSVNCYARRGDSESTRPVLWFHIKCLPDYQEQALQLLAEVFSSVSFSDQARIREIAGREFAWGEHAVQSEGYSLAATRVFAHLSRAGRYNELVSGVTSYLAIKNLVLNYQEKEQQFSGTLQSIGSQLFSIKNMIISTTAGGRELARFEQLGRIIVEALSTREPASPQPPELQLKSHEAFITAAEVVFAVQGGNLLKNGDGYNGHFEVLKTYLSRDYLWNTVRQMGGAYGCFIQFGQISGNLAYVSYRDPQVQKTYDAYNKVPEVVASLHPGREAMLQLITGTYGNFDPLQSAAAKGAAARNDYLNGVTPEFKQQRLQAIA